MLLLYYIYILYVYDFISISVNNSISVEMVSRNVGSQYSILVFNKDLARV